MTQCSYIQESSIKLQTCQLLYLLNEKIIFKTKWSSAFYSKAFPVFCVEVVLFANKSNSANVRLLHYICQGVIYHCIHIGCFFRAFWEARHLSLNIFFLEVVNRCKKCFSHFEMIHRHLTVHQVLLTRRC